MNIIYKDEEVVVCIKPVGVLSQSGKEGEESMVNILKECLGKPVYAVHRLDKDVSGVMVYAVSKKAAAELSAQVSDRKMKKRYFAVVHSSDIKGDGLMEDLLYFDKRKNKSYVVKRERKGVKKAVLEYSFIKEKDNLSLFDINLLTGRTHQIRVQFASRKMPLVGDRRYGAKDEEKHIALFSYHISFSHPKTGEAMSFEVKPESEIFIM